LTLGWQAPVEQQCLRGLEEDGIQWRRQSRQYGQGQRVGRRRIIGGECCHERRANTGGNQHVGHGGDRGFAFSVRQPFQARTERAGDEEGRTTAVQVDGGRGEHAPGVGIGLAGRQRP